MNSDERQIHELMKKWRDATAGGDVETVLNLMTDDAVFLTPGNPPLSKADFAIGLKGFAGKVRIESSQDVKELHAAGDLAYAWSRISVTMISNGSGRKIERAGHILTIFRKTADGRWLLARDANFIAEVPEGA